MFRSEVFLDKDFFFNKGLGWVVLQSALYSRSLRWRRMWQYLLLQALKLHTRNNQKKLVSAKKLIKKKGMPRGGDNHVQRVHF